MIILRPAKDTTDGRGSRASHEHQDIKSHEISSQWYANLAGPAF